MRRLAVALLNALLVALLAIPAGAGVVSATDVIRFSMHGLSARATWSSTIDGLRTDTFIAAADEIVRDDGTVTSGGQAFVYQTIIAVDPDGNETLLRESFGFVPASVVVDVRLDEGSVSAASDWTVCTPDTGCLSEPLVLSGSWRGVGAIDRSQQTSVYGFSSVSQEVAHHVDQYRLAMAAATINGDATGETVSLLDASLSDTKVGYISVAVGADGPVDGAYAATTAPATGTPITFSNRGKLADAEWAAQTDGVYTDTNLTASSQRSVANGTHVDERSILFSQSTYTFDEFGNQVPLQIVFSEATGVDFTLGAGLTAAHVGGTVPITTCTYVSPDEPICIDDAAPLVADWVGVGQSQHVQNLTTAVSVGQYRFLNRVTGTRRAATANGSLGGTSFGSSTYAVLASFSSGSLDIRFGAH